MKLKKITVVVLLSMYAASSGATGFQDMWNSNATAAGPITTQDRSGYSGGSATFRTPIKSFTVANFAPPRASAGCAGADIYMGSFSYINEQQIISTLQAIMQNAQGLIFQAAIEFVSPMISGLMKNFNDLAQKINGQAQNSCEIATSMMGSINRGAREYGEQMKNALAENGTTSDWLGLKTNPGATSAAAVKAAEVNLPTTGNITWRGLIGAGAGKKVNFLMFPAPGTDPTTSLATEQYNSEILMSFTGTFIKTSKNGNQANGAAAAFDPQVTTHDHFLSLFDLINGGEGKNKYTCPGAALDQECLTPTVAALKFVDAVTYVDVMLMGDPAWLDPTNAASNGDTSKIKALLADSAQLSATLNGKPLRAHPKSLAAIIAGADGVPSSTVLTAAQQAFLEVVKAPIVQMIADLKNGEYEQIAALSNLLKNRIALALVQDTADSVISSLKNMETATKTDGSPGNTSKVELSERVLSRIKELSEERAAIEQMLVATAEKEIEARKFVDSIIAARSRVRTGLK